MLFEWLHGGRSKPDLVERGLALATGRQYQVSPMNRIKAAAKDA